MWNQPKTVQLVKITCVGKIQNVNNIYRKIIKTKELKYIYIHTHINK